MYKETSSGFSWFFNVKMNSDQDGIQGRLIVSVSQDLIRITAYMDLYLNSLERSWL